MKGLSKKQTEQLYDGMMHAAGAYMGAAKKLLDAIMLKEGALGALVRLEEAQNSASYATEILDDVMVEVRKVYDAQYPGAKEDEE